MAPFTARQKEIIDAAISIIAGRGIQELTIKNLSKAIGISEPAIYRHYNSKMDILLGVLTFFEDINLGIFNKALSMAGTTPEKLEFIYKQHFDHFSNNPPLAAVVFSEEIFQNDQRLSARVSALMSRSQKHLLKIIEEGLNNGELRNDLSKEELSMIIMGPLRLIVVRWHLSKYGFDLKQKGNKLWMALKKLIQKEN
jgi:AcrR family transcriptional regulator